MLDLLREEPGSSFSDLWYRLGDTRPRLASHAQVIRQRFGGRTVFVIEDPAGGQYYRLSEAAYFWLGLLDGSRRVDESWRSAQAQLGEDAPTQRECVDLLARLQIHGLLEGEGPIAPDMLARRRQQAARSRFRQRAGMGVSFTLPLVNPQRFLASTSWLWRAAYSWGGLAVYVLALGAGLYSVLTRPDAIFGDFNSVLDPGNVAWLALVLVLLRAWHELGHAAACTALGARCSELGLMFVLLVFPFPYCDATAAWRLPQAWKRVVVSAGGMLFETFVASLAAVVWARSEPGLVRTLCYNTMVLSGVTTILFNINPLLRYDGYYIVSDVLGIPNLWQRSRDAAKFLLERVAFNVSAARPPSVRGPGEFWMLVAYAVCSIPYRILVAFTLIYAVWSSPRYLTLGAVLAFAGFVLFVAWPVARGAGYLLGSPKLLGRRSRALGVGAGVVALGLAALGLVPVSASADAPAILRAGDERPLRFGEDGFVERVLARPGARVEGGQPLVELRSPDVEAALAQARSRRDEALARRDQAAASDPTRRQIEERGVEQAAAELARAQARHDALVLRSPMPGVFVPGKSAGLEVENLPGQFVRRGDLLGYVVEPGRMVARAALSDRDQAFVFPHGPKIELDARGSPSVHAQVRVRGQASRAIPAQITQFPSAGSHQLDAPALGISAGGDVIEDPSDRRGQTALESQFLVELVLPSGDGVAMFSGQRARVRFTLPPRPLLTQWYRRFVQRFGEQSPI